MKTFTLDEIKTICRRLIDKTSHRLDPEQFASMLYFELDHNGDVLVAESKVNNRMTQVWKRNHYKNNFELNEYKLNEETLKFEICGWLYFDTEQLALDYSDLWLNGKMKGQ